MKQFFFLWLYTVQFTLRVTVHTYAKRLIHFFVQLHYSEIECHRVSRGNGEWGLASGHALCPVCAVGRARLASRVTSTVQITCGGRCLEGNGCNGGVPFARLMRVVRLDPKVRCSLARRAPPTITSSSLGPATQYTAALHTSRASACLG